MEPGDKSTGPFESAFESEIAMVGGTEYFMEFTGSDEVSEKGRPKEPNASGFPEEKLRRESNGTPPSRFDPERSRLSEEGVNAVVSGEEDTVVEEEDDVFGAVAPLPVKSKGSFLISLESSFFTSDEDFIALGLDKFKAEADEEEEEVAVVDSEVTRGSTDVLGVLDVSSIGSFFTFFFSVDD